MHGVTLNMFLLFREIIVCKQISVYGDRFENVEIFSKMLISLDIFVLMRHLPENQF